MLNDSGVPLVSAIISTYFRPEMVFRAVQFTLAQTLKEIEIIAVLNGLDDLTVKALRTIQDPRLRIKILPARVGPGSARNAGVREARGTWIAFLDNGDEWLPQKLEAQFHAARGSRYEYPIISCRLIGRRKGADLIWPRRFPDPEEDISEYLFCRRSPFYGEGLIKPSTIFTRKELLQKIPFREDLKQHEDYDWLLRIKNLKGVGVQFVNTQEPLAIWTIEDDREELDLSGTLSWMRENKALFTPRAYASFLLTGFSHSVAKTRNWKGFFLLLREAFQNGRPAALHVFLHLANWLLPVEVKQLSSSGGAAPQ